MPSPLFPRLRWAAVAWMAVWAPVYFVHHGPRNFIYLCDISVVLTTVGLWRGSALLLSSQALSSLLVESLWTVDAGARLLTGRHPIGGTEYMWQADLPLGLRLMSLFHVIWPPLLLYAIRRTGYDRRALALQAGIAAAALIAARLLGGEERNINFAFRDPFFGRSWGPPAAHLAVTWTVLVAACYVPLHLVLRRLFPRRR